MDCNKDIRGKNFFRQVFRRNIITWIALIVVILTAFGFFLMHIKENDVEEEERVLSVPKIRQEIVWIVSCRGSRITYYKQGNEYAKSAEISAKNEGISDTYAILSYKNDRITGIKQLNEVKSGRVLSYSEDSVNILEKNNETELVLEKDAPILEEDDFSLRERRGSYSSISDLGIEQIGSREANFFMNEGKVVGIMVKKQEETMIRVLLNEGNYRGLYHDKVTISCSEAFTMTCGKRKKNYAKGKKLTIMKQNALFKQDSLVFSSKKGGSFTIEGIERSAKLSYPGKIEFIKRSEGIMVINELPLDEYLCRVVNSEMPESFGLEALKAQAVCARSYAAIKLKQSDFHRYGADVDDSTQCQVYNNQAMNPTATKAVNATKGQVLWKDGHIETAYYFSTSCGHTSTKEQVWGTGGAANNGNWQIDVFSDDAKKNGKTKEVIATISEKNLSKEDSMTAFLMGEAPFSNKLMLEKDDPWYRWQVKMSKNDWGKSIKKRLAEETASPNTNIFKKNSKGAWENARISDFGSLTGVKVLKREKSGLVTQIELEGTKETVKVQGEYCIRKILMPANAPIVKQDKTKVENFPLLPSAYFSFSSTKTDWILTGGGYGHGVGMSQYGAKDLGERGCTYLQILKYYYPDCQLKEGF